jgi:hypothetical protein
MLRELIRLANDLDGKGHRKEADYLDMIIRKAQAAEGAENASSGDPSLYDRMNPWSEHRQERRQGRRQERQERGEQHDAEQLAGRQEKFEGRGDLYFEFKLIVKPSGDEKKDRYVAQQLPEAQGLAGMLFGTGLDKNLLTPSTGRLINRVRLMTPPSWFPASGLGALHGGIPVRVILDQLPADASAAHAAVQPGSPEYTAARTLVMTKVKDAIARKLGMNAGLLEVE